MAQEATIKINLEEGNSGATLKDLKNDDELKKITIKRLKYKMYEFNTEIENMKYLKS